MKLEKAAILTCSTCGIEGEHELLYLSHRLASSRCANCGKTQVYSGRIYSEYFRDVVDRTLHLPVKLAGEAMKTPTRVATWPFKAARKPFRLLSEVNEVTSLEIERRYPGFRFRASKPGYLPRGTLGLSR